MTNDMQRAMTALPIRQDRLEKDASEGDPPWERLSWEEEASNEEHANEPGPMGTFRLGGYHICECIGSGGMARVYRAEHEALGRHVAVKVLNADFAGDSEAQARFLREARIAAAIKHPNVVEIFDVGVHQGMPYLVMELLEGEDLESMLCRGGSRSVTEIVDAVVPIVGGLAAVHEAGVVHRDLKPGNIFLAREAHGAVVPKLVDFGISKAAWPGQEKLTQAGGVLLGTPVYLAPEVIQGEEATALSDQYSLGVVLYEALTGTNPFAERSLVQALQLICSGGCLSASKHRPELPSRLVRIVGRAMSVEPARRYGDIRALGRELLELASEETRLLWSVSLGGTRPKLVPAGPRAFGWSAPLGRVWPWLRTLGVSLRRLSSSWALVFWIAAVLALQGLSRIATVRIAMVGSWLGRLSAKVWPCVSRFPGFDALRRGVRRAERAVQPFERSLLTAIVGAVFGGGVATAVYRVEGESLAQRTEEARAEEGKHAAGNGVDDESLSTISRPLGASMPRHSTGNEDLAGSDRARRADGTEAASGGEDGALEVVDVQPLEPASARGDASQQAAADRKKRLKPRTRRRRSTSTILGTNQAPIFD